MAAGGVPEFGRQWRCVALPLAQVGMQGGGRMVSQVCGRCRLMVGILSEVVGVVFWVLQGCRRMCSVVALAPPVPPPTAAAGVHLWGVVWVSVGVRARVLSALCLRLGCVG